MKCYIINKLSLNSVLFKVQPLHTHGKKLSTKLWKYPRFGYVPCLLRNYYDAGVTFEIGEVQHGYYLTMN